MDDLYAKPSLSAAIECIRRRWPSVQSGSDDTPVFVLAAGWYSGQDILRQMMMPSCLLWSEPYGHASPIDSLAASVRSITLAWPQDDAIADGGNGKTECAEQCNEWHPPVKSLLDAHLSYFDELFARPARETGAAQWGISEARWTADHAYYLKWLFPKAKFVFLYRNPYDVYRCFVAARKSGRKLYSRWPNHPLTIGGFGRHWRELVLSFQNGCQRVDGLLVEYGDLAAGSLQPIEEYLKMPLSREALESDAPQDGPASLAPIPEIELVELEAEVAEVASSLSYHCEDASRAKTPSLDQTAISIDVRPTTQTEEPRPDPSKCVVLVPVASMIEPACDDALYELQRRGYQVRRVRGYAAIDQGRNQMATDALTDGFEETMWIDSDIEFQPDDIDRLRRHNLPIVSAVYPKKGKRALASHVLPGTDKLVFGNEGGLAEIKYAATGFLLVRHQVYTEMQRRLKLPLCNQRFEKPTIPFFQPMIRPDGDGHWYLAEDYAFSERVGQCGFKIYADTRIRLGHIGKYSFTWEDAGSQKRRYATYCYHLGEQDPTKTRGKGDRSNLPERPSGCSAQIGPVPFSEPASAVRDGLPDRHLPYHYPGGKIFLNVAGSRKAVTQALGIYHPFQTKALAAVLKPGMTFADVGAATGYYTFLAARLVGPKGRVLAFEPVPERCRWFRKGVEVNRYEWIELLDTALADTDGTANSYRDATSGSYTLAAREDNQASDSLSVGKRPLDTLLAERGQPRIDVLKLDVNGAEREFFDGARQTLGDSRNISLIVNLSPRIGSRPEQVCECLRDMGFALFDIRDPGKRELEIHPELDCIFAQK